MIPPASNDSKPKGADRRAIRDRHWGNRSVELRGGLDEYLIVPKRDVDPDEGDLVVTAQGSAWIYDSCRRGRPIERHRKLDLLKMAGDDLYEPSHFVDDALDARVRNALGHGRLVLLRLPREPDAGLTRPPAPPEWPSAPPPRPPPPDEIFRYPVTVIDDTGKAVDGARLKFDIDGTPRMSTTNGAGDGTTEWVVSTRGTVRVLDLPGLRGKLKSRWKASRPRSVPASARQAVDEEPIDFGVTSGQRTQIVLTRPGPPVRRVRMVGMLFDADKCFLLPSAVPGIRSIVAMHTSHAGDEVLVMGHAESDEICGGTSIALDRAKALIAYLTNDPAAWLSWFDPGVERRKRWGTRELQLMLSAVSDDSRPLFGGYASGVTDRATRTAIRNFQKSAGLEIDGKAGPKTRKALVTKYMGIEGTTLPRSAKLMPLGCEGHRDDTLVDDGLQPDDRRAEVFFFEKELTPAPAGEVSPAGSPEYDEWRSRLVETVDFENHGIHIQVLDVKERPVPFAQVTLSGPASQRVTADAHGFVSFFGLAAGDYTLQAECKGYSIGSSKLRYPTANTVPGILGERDVWRVRMVGMLFDADKCFLLPEALGGLQKAMALQKQHAGAEVLVLGHADGDEVHAGADLALARAKSMVAFLTRKPDTWLRWFRKDVPLRKRWGTREVQLMLSALPKGGSPFYDGYASGVKDAATVRAIRAFQRSAGLAVDSKPGPLTRKALVARYLGLLDSPLADGTVVLAHGCQGQIDPTLTEDGLQPDDRRLEVLFFDNGIRPRPDGDTRGRNGPGADDYAAWMARLVETQDFEVHGVHVQITDTRGSPVPFAKVHIEGPTTGDEVADANGFVTFLGLAAGTYALRAEVDGRPPVTSTLTYPTARTIDGRLAAR